MRLGKARNIIFQHRCVLSHVPRTRTQWIDRLERGFNHVFFEIRGGEDDILPWACKAAL